MKKQLVASIIGMGISAATITSSFGQGTILFSTYISSAVHALVVWGSGIPGHAAGTAVVGGDGVYAELYYGIGSGLSWNQLTPIASSITPVGTQFPGAITGPVVEIPDYKSGPVTFGIALVGTSFSYPWFGPIWTEPSGVVVAPGLPANTFTPSLLDAICPNGSCWTCLSCNPPPPPPPQFYYTTTNGTITITGYTGPGGALVIPSTINGLPVTSVGNAAFAGLTSLTNVNIPDSVTSIGEWAFSQCTRLTNVTIPNTVTNIGYGAFRFCNGLTSVTIPDSVVSLGADAFSECFSLASINIGNGITCLDTNTFADCISLTDITIPSSVTSIGFAAFRNCHSVTNLAIPNSVTAIGAWAFAECTSLTSVTIPYSVTTIGDFAFRYCVWLVAINVDTLNSSYQSMDGVLFNKSQTVLLEYPAGKLENSFAIPKGTTNIGLGAFEFCRNLASVTIPDNVISIGDEAFLECASLTNITIPNSVTSIGEFAFSYCTSITGVVIGHGLTSIAEFTFGGCTNLTSVAIPSSVTNVGDMAFEGCASLTSITIPSSVTGIGSSAFEGCASLTSITIPEGVTGIGIRAFFSCYGLTNVMIGNRVNIIGSSAFQYCTSLTSVTIGNGVTNLGDASFYQCTNLASVYFQGNGPSLGSLVFSGDNNVTVYYLPGTTGWGSTFGGCPTVLWVLPSASNLAAATLQDHPMNLALTKLLALASHPLAGSLSFANVSATSTNGGSVVLDQNQITYTPVAGYIGADLFSYTLTDAMDETASAYVFVTVLATDQITANMLPLSAIPGGYVVSFAGIPGRTYSVQRAPTVIGPWVTIATVTVGTDGLGVIQDTNSLDGAAFYRTTYP